MFETSRKTVADRLLAGGGALAWESGVGRLSGSGTLFGLSAVSSSMSSTGGSGA
jgi:hypothetical protein